MSQTKSSSSSSIEDLADNEGEYDELKKQVNKEAQEKMSEAVAKISLAQLPFFAVLLGKTDRHPTQAIDTLATDGNQIVYNPMFLADKNINAVMFLVAHEAMHIALEHNIRGKNFGNNKKWNIATDLAVNQHLKEDSDLYVGLQGAVQDDKFSGMAAEEIFKELPDDPQMYQFPDIHDDPGYDRGPGENLDGHLDGPEVNTSEHVEIQDKIIEAHDAAEHGQGNVPGEVGERVEKLKENYVDWRRVFHNYVGTAIGRNGFSALPPHRHWLDQLGICLPSRRSKELREVVVSLDTSGSISSDQLSEFAGEVESISHLVDEVHLILADCDVHETIPTEDVKEFIEDGNWSGRGGTDHVPIFEHLEENNIFPELFIAFTDGKTTIPNRTPKFPVAWVITEDGTEEFLEWGKVVRMAEPNLY